MKLYIKTLDNVIIESCTTALDDSQEIDVTAEQLELIKLQYDTVVDDNGNIVSQTKGVNANDLELSIIESEKIVSNDEITSGPIQ